MPCGYKEVSCRRPALFSTTHTVLTRQEPAEAQALFCLFIAVTEKVVFVYNFLKQVILERIFKFLNVVYLCLPRQVYGSNNTLKSLV